MEHTRATQNKDKNNAIAKHMEILHNSNFKLLKFYAIDHVKTNIRGGNRELILRQKESCHILNFRTMAPFGLNKSEELYIHL